MEIGPGSVGLQVLRTKRNTIHHYRHGVHTRSLGDAWDCNSKILQNQSQNFERATSSTNKKGSYDDADEARAEPLWCSYRHNIKVSNAWDWRKHLHTNRVNDLINHNTNSRWSPNELRGWFTEHLLQVSPETKYILQMATRCIRTHPHHRNLDKRLL